MFKNRVLRRIFEPKREGVVGGLRELHNVYDSRNIIRVIHSRRMRWAVHGAGMGVVRNAYRILVEKPEAKKPPVTGRSR
jgi:hypothetical protein